MTDELNSKSKKHTLPIIKLANYLPNSKVGSTFANQHIRSSCLGGCKLLCCLQGWRLLRFYLVIEYCY
jgi:hypothetical protein